MALPFSYLELANNSHENSGIKNRTNSFSSKVSINSNERGRGVKNQSSISYNEKRKVPYFFYT